MSEQPTITKTQARAAMALLEESVRGFRHTMSLAPYARAKQGIEALETLVESVAGELGLEFVSHCEGCDEVIFDGDNYMTCIDGPYLCEECTPPLDERIAQMRERVAAGQSEEGDEEYLAELDAKRPETVE